MLNYNLKNQYNKMQRQVFYIHYTVSFYYVINYNRAKSRPRQLCNTKITKYTYQINTAYKATP